MLNNERLYRKFKFISIIATAALVTSQTPAIADSARHPVPWVTTSKYGNYLFKMVPNKWRKVGERYVIAREAFGVAYKMTTDGRFEEIWDSKGWYSFKGYLSDNGRYFVRFGHGTRHQKTPIDLAIAFYDRGKLIKRYSVRELLKKPESIEYSASHYSWRPEIQTEPNGFKSGTFYLVMIDKTAYSFDFKTGAILETNIDNGAKSFREIRAEEKAIANIKGKELFQASPIKDAFSRHFNVTGIEEMRGYNLGSSYQGPGWTAKLEPKEKLAHKARVTVIFPITNGNQLDVSISPTDIITALRTALEHPFVAKRFDNGGATRIRLRILGDRLHWDTSELVKLLSEIYGEKPKEDSLGHWAYIIIDANKHHHTSVYFNTRTKDLLYEDNSQWPYVPILVDADGEPKPPH